MVVGTSRSRAAATRNLFYIKFYFQCVRHFTAITNLLSALIPS
jgi:hypothetical protein